MKVLLFICRHLRCSMRCARDREHLFEHVVLQAILADHLDPETEEQSATVTLLNIVGQVCPQGEYPVCLKELGVCRGTRHLHHLQFLLICSTLDDCKVENGHQMTIRLRLLRICPRVSKMPLTRCRALVSLDRCSHHASMLHFSMLQQSAFSCSSSSNVSVGQFWGQTLDTAQTLAVSAEQLVL